MNKLVILVFLALFCGLARGQNDTARIIPPKPDSTVTESEPVAPPTPTVNPRENREKKDTKKKRPKGYDDYVNKGKRPVDRPLFWENVYYGCNIQLGFSQTSFGSALYYDLSPHAGYKFNEFFSAGVQIIYNNTQYTYGVRKYNYNIFGAGVFGRALILDRFFFQAEIDALSVPANFGVSTRRATSDEKMVGFGYKSPLGEKLGYFFVLMYDIQPGPNSPYLYYPLVYRAGLSWNF